LDRHSGGRRVVDLVVVDLERALRLAGLEEVEREVPPVVDGEEVARVPSRRVTGQETDPLVDAALHLVRVHHGMNSPHIVGVAVYRGETGGEGLVVVGRRLPADGEPAA